MDDYNRAHFPLDLDEALFDGFKAALSAGGRAPSGRLIDAHSGEVAQLSKLWSQPLVIEFGSHT